MNIVQEFVLDYIVILVLIVAFIYGLSLLAPDYKGDKNGNRLPKDE
tara:strand:- start:196 stop:333 length:138 start_codon:yes stop_codon:yes gene_type:complete